VGKSGEFSGRRRSQRPWTHPRWLHAAKMVLSRRKIKPFITWKRSIEIGQAPGAVTTGSPQPGTAAASNTAQFGPRSSTAGCFSSNSCALAVERFSSVVCRHHQPASEVF
jgi:hypothetical protein